MFRWFRPENYGKMSESRVANVLDELQDVMLIRQLRAPPLEQQQWSDNIAAIRRIAKDIRSRSRSAFGITQVDILKRLVSS